MTYDAIIEYLINDLGYTLQQAKRELRNFPIIEPPSTEEEAQ